MLRKLLQTGGLTVALASGAASFPATLAHAQSTVLAECEITELVGDWTMETFVTASSLRSARNASNEFAVRFTGDCGEVDGEGLKTAYLGRAITRSADRTSLSMRSADVGAFPLMVSFTERFSNGRTSDGTFVVTDRDGPTTLYGKFTSGRGDIFGYFRLTRTY